MQALETKKKDIIDFFLKKGLLINKDLLIYLEEGDNLSVFSKIVNKNNSKDIAVLSEKIKDLLDKEQNLNWTELEKLKIISEKKRIDGVIPIDQIPSYKKNDDLDNSSNYNVKVIFSYSEASKKREANDFIQYFNNRFQSIEKILKQRLELQNTTSINQIILCGIWNI